MLAPMIFFAAALAAPPPVVETVTTTEVAAAAPEDDPFPLLGVSLDAGVPSGIGASLLVRPLPFFRAHGGLGTNGAGVGLHLGASVIPLQAILSPTFTLEAGHFFEGDANRFAEFAGMAPRFGDSLLRDFSYTYASALVGLEAGSQRGLSVFVRGGLSYVDMPVNGLTELLEDSKKGVRFEAKPANLSLLAPSFELGVSLFVL